MAKKKAQSSKPSASAGLAIAIVGLACAGGGYYAGKNSDAIEPRIAALIGSDKAAAPAAKSSPEPKAAEAPRAVKSTDKAELARLLKGDAKSESRSAEAKEPRPPADIPTPPAKPELAKADDAAAPAPAAARREEQPAPLAFALLDRDVAQSAENGEQVTLALNFENLAGKPIRAFEGVVKVSDQQDNAIYSTKISVSALIAENGALRWDQHVDARKLDEKGKRLLAEDKSNLRAVFLLKKIFFVDGSVQKYAMPPRAAQAG